MHPVCDPGYQGLTRGLVLHHGALHRDDIGIDPTQVDRLIQPDRVPRGVQMEIVPTDTLLEWNAKQVPSRLDVRGQ